MTPEPFHIVRAEYSLEDPWEVPAGATAVALVRSTDGSAARQSTSVAAYFDGDFLTVVFLGTDDEVVATHREHDAPLYHEDVVELFLAPSTSGDYFEIEVNPLGTTFDARISSPTGTRERMTTDVSWTCDGLFAAIRRDGRSLDVVVRVPFRSLGRDVPVEGESWSGNFFRIDRSRRHGDEFLAWSPTLRNPPDFHVAATFGKLVFVAASRP